MDFMAPAIQRVQQVPIGSLFILLHASKGNAICFRATFNLSSDDEEYQRAVPLYWPGEPSSVGIPIYVSSLSGDAIVLSDARLEVSPLTATATPGSLAAVYCREGRLFFPLNNNDRIGGLVDAETGEIEISVRGHLVAFDKWFITVADDSRTRKVIFPVAVED